MGQGHELGASAEEVPRSWMRFVEAHTEPDESPLTAAKGAYRVNVPVTGIPLRITEVRFHIVDLAVEGGEEIVSYAAEYCAGNDTVLSVSYNASRNPGFIQWLADEEFINLGGDSLQELSRAMSDFNAMEAQGLAIKIPSADK